MKLLPAFIALVFCFNSITQTNNHSINPTLKNQDYRLYLNKSDKQSGTFILFPCFPCDAENTVKEFNIVHNALSNGMSVIMMNFNFHLYLTNSDKENLTSTLNEVFKKYDLSQQRVVIGGFSSGGNVSLLLGNYLHQQQISFAPTHLFVVDSPIDLLQLYRNAEKTIERSKAKVALDEAHFILDLLNKEFGSPTKSIQPYKKHSPYLSSIHYTDNLSYLNQVKVRLYTEPDVNWWKTNRNATYEQLNAYVLKQLGNDIKTFELIETQNMGIRANGERHPHSWSIVSPTELLNWVME